MSTNLAVVAGTPIDVTIGAGGAAGSGDFVPGGSGTPSSFSTAVAYGGGGGGTQGDGPAYGGYSGADFGGGSGELAFSENGDNAGGGAGAGAAGGNASSTGGGAGGAGVTPTSGLFADNTTSYGGGGGGGSESTIGNGTDGGGNGSYDTGEGYAPATSAAANRGGGGGGGARDKAAGAGASGLIIVRYLAFLPKSDQSALTVTGATSPAATGTTQTLGTSGGSTAGAVTWAVTNDTDACTVNSSTGEVTITAGTGTCKVTATMAGDSTYNPVTSSPQTITVEPGEQAALTITSTTATFGTDLTLATSGGSGTGAVTYTVLSGPCSISLDGLSLISTGVGTCSVQATKAGDDDYQSVDSAPTDITVGKANQAALTLTVTSPATYGTSQTASATGGTVEVNPTFSAGASTACAVDADTGEVLITHGTGTCSITATIAGDDNYNEVSDTQAITVAKAAQPTLVVSTTSGTVGQALTLATTGGAGSGAITFVLDSGACTLTDPELTAAAPVTCAVTASKATDDDYLAADSASTDVVFTNAPVPAPPAPSPTTPTQPAAPTVPAPAAPLPAPAPVVPGSVPQLPASGLTPGASLLLVNGQPTPVIINPAASGAGLTATGAGFTMNLVGQGTNARPLQLAPDGALILEQDRTAAVSGTGFTPNSEVAVTLFSTPRLLGTVMTDETGSFSEVLPVPADVPTGRHTLQTNGTSADGQARSLSLGVILSKDTLPKGKLRHQVETVYFAPLSSHLTTTSKKALRDFVSGRKVVAVSTTATGHVQSTTVTSNDKALATKRANAVVAYLKSLGVKGKFTVKVGSNPAQQGSTGRNVVVHLAYRR